MTTTPSLDEMLQLAGEHAQRMLVGGEVESLIPTYQLWNRDELLSIVACPWSDEAEKEFAFDKVRMLARQMRATRLVFLSEAWMATAKPTDDLDRMDPPSQRPDRQEVVFAVATDGKRKKARSWAIVRDKPGGKITALTEQPMEAGSFGGRAIDGIL
jgi:hypothetical protein